MTEQPMTQQQTCLRGLELAERFIPSMLPGHAYTAETMCGIAFWKRLPHGMPSIVGQAIALAVDTGVLNLRVAYVNSDDKNWYALLYDEPEQESETNIDPISIKLN